MRKTHAFSKKALSSRTPTWAKNMFRIVFFMTTALVAWLAATNLVTEETKYELTLVLKVIIDPLTYLLSKMFGVTNESEETE